MRFGMAEQHGIPKKGRWVTRTHHIGYYNVAIWNVMKYVIIVYYIFQKPNMLFVRYKSLL